MTIPDARWHVPALDERTHELARALDITPWAAQCLINRGVDSVEGAARFLEPALASMRDPFLLAGMDDAVRVLIHAFDTKEQIALYGDYDVDGTTAAAILKTFCQALEVTPEPIVVHPHRMTHGYGLHRDLVEELIGNGVQLIVTLDLGTSNHDEIAFIQQRGAQCIVIDHHQIPTVLPPADAVINPYRADSEFPFQGLASAGLAFYVAVAVRQRLRDRGYFDTHPEPDLRAWLDLVALGTICDMMPLTDENRIFVRAGLTELAREERPGVAALKTVAGVGGQAVTAGKVAFTLGPRINAAGRMDSAHQASSLLVTDDPEEARGLAHQLDTFNHTRRAEERRVISEAIAAVEDNDQLDRHRALVVSGEGWHSGIVGIVASRLVDRYHRPAVVISMNNGTGVGSARSIRGLHMYKALASCAHVLEKFGGHAQAAGLTVRADNLDEFTHAFLDVVDETLTDDDLVPHITCDAVIPGDAVSLELARELERLEPFGIGNPAPVFAVTDIDIVHAQQVGAEKQHLRLRLKPRGGGAPVHAIYFRHGNLFQEQYPALEVALTPETSVWKGKQRLDLIVKGLRRERG